MPLDVPNGERCFVDANILYYCFVETPDFSVASRDFLHRAQQADVDAVTSVRCLSDCIHKTMLAEISQRFGRSRDRLIGWLKQNPNAFDQLPKTAEVCSRLLQLRLTVLPHEASILSQAVALSQSHQLLLGDATIVALMQRHGITHLATNDDDFARVPGITIWQPRAAAS
jgi:predicted nucleic acid-binding protein